MTFMTTTGILRLSYYFNDHPWHFMTIMTFVTCRHPEILTLFRDFLETHIKELRQIFRTEGSAQKTFHLEGNFFAEKSCELQDF